MSWWKRVVAGAFLALAAVGGAVALWAVMPERAEFDPAPILDAARRYRVRILRDEFGVPHIYGGTDADVAYGLAFAHAEDGLIGSNAIAVGPARSADGATRLLVNSHQPYAGPVSWYQVRLKSEEGWDMAGGVFPGSPVVVHGHNRNLGWANTVNRPDLVDVYRLEINPENPNQYRFDGEWRDLEVGEAEISVRIFGRLRWTVRRELLRSVHGPVIRRDHGTFALRYAGMDEIRQLEQYCLGLRGQLEPHTLPRHRRPRQSGSRRLLSHPRLRDAHDQPGAPRWS
jgi:acyl-homoserine lactone acylase PvdQ